MVPAMRSPWLLIGLVAALVHSAFSQTAPDPSQQQPSSPRPASPQPNPETNLDPWTPLREPKLPAAAEDVKVPAPAGTPPLSEKEIWANAKPYIDDSMVDLQKELPELRGMQPAPNQDALPRILAGVGETCVEQLRRTPNVIADEEITTLVPHFARLRQNVEYLVLVNRTASDQTLREYRADRHGKPVANASSAQGFASMWVHFFPANQGESRYRLLGKQHIGRREVVLVAFAQIPEKVRFPAEFDVDSRHTSIFFQGVVWIDASDWRILRVREDLLAPRPDVNLATFTARVRLGSVNVKKAATALWLPQEADLEWTLKERSAVEEHTYSHYRLYMTKTKMIYTP